MKHQFLSELRSDTCYPSFRAFVGVFKAIGYLAGGAVIVACLVSGNLTAIALGIVAAALIVLLVMAIAECSSMLADIADATIDSASEQRGGVVRSAVAGEVDVSAFAARARSGDYTHG